MRSDGIILFIKYPEPGRVKTRISEKLGKEFTAELYRCFVSDILKKLSGVDADILIYFTPAGKKRKILEWLGPGLQLHPQSGGDIGERMKNAFEDQFKAGYSSLILIGSDIPHVWVSTLLNAFEILKKKGALIGPAEDGGYYLIGFNSEHFLPAVFQGISWSVNSVFTETEKLFKKEGLKPAILPVMLDIDTVENLERVLRESAADMPDTAAFWNEKEGRAYGS